ncbi:hypothetical protein HHK36_011197 [Tetracentron sinense]|uniref:Protein FAR1-RELATED SEQUENCE n=1 Tax=Tetracentron sinense TaxID=13715 RepID=A0A834ZD05_TETSI|nr:hypothetical protein HHK36_011197 [Tetracentron sinense]
MATEAGRYDKLGFDEEDIRRYVRNIAKQTYGTDANNMLDYFKNKQAENPAFFYSIQLDESAQLCNCFWVDARARVDYFHFGDAISLTPQWLKAMGNRHPSSIITDQDPAMKAAIAKDWVNKHTTLRDFVEKYDMALQKRRELEIRQDHKSSTEQPIRSSRSKMEKQFADVFTHKMFKKFQRELIETISCYTKLVEHDGSMKKYEIASDSNMKKKYVVSYVEGVKYADTNMNIQARVLCETRCGSVLLYPWS